MKGIKSLKDKTVLLTGAAGGIGTILAKKLYFEEAASLILVDIDIKKLKELKSDIENTNKLRKNPINNSDIQIFEADLSSSLVINKLFKKIEKLNVDVLINNAGIIYPVLFRNLNLEDFDHVVSINLQAAVRLTRLLLPKLIENKGFIVNVASGAGLIGIAGLSAYSISKFGLVGFSQALRAELRGTVGVSTICPAFVATNIVHNSLMSSKFKQQSENEQIDKLDKFVRFLGVSPERVARIIIKSIKKNKGVVPVGMITHLVYNQNKITPGLVNFFNTLICRSITKRGLVK